MSSSDIAKIRIPDADVINALDKGCPPDLLLDLEKEFKEKQEKDREEARTAQSLDSGAEDLSLAVVPAADSEVPALQKFLSEFPVLKPN